MRYRQELLLFLLTTVTICTISSRVSGQNFRPDFSSLEKANPVPDWFKDAKFGIYFHWGVYSVPAFGK